MNFKNMGSEGSKDSRPQPASPMPLARQLSVYSLTFDEFQNTLGGPGKDFGSMNMDEFLRNIWTAEESHAMASAMASTADSGAPAGPGGSAGLQRQGSLTLPRTLSQKTVDEVWKDLLRESGSGGQGFAAATAAAGTELQQRRQQTLGEMTLEEFLVRAGVVREDMNQQPVQRPSNQGTTNNSNSIFFGELPSSNNNDNPGLALGFLQTAGRNAGGIVHNQIPNSLAMSGTATARPYPSPLQVGSNVDIRNQQGMRGGGIVGIGDTGLNNGLISSVVGLGGGGGGVTVAAAVGSPDGLGKGNGDLSSLSPVPYHMFGSGMRGRKCSGAVEKVVERRQRRMIKNRESAARSRARKQAYTMELEAEVAKLKEQNEELQKKQAEIMEMQKNQVMEIINQQRGQKKLCLRRTNTGPW